jgi:hypothetical protein
MEEFYTNLWQKKLPKLEALRQAQLTVLWHRERVELSPDWNLQQAGLKLIGRVERRHIGRGFVWELLRSMLDRERGPSDRSCRTVGIVGFTLGQQEGMH